MYCILLYAFLKTEIILLLLIFELRNSSEGITPIRSFLARGVREGGGAGNNSRFKKEHVRED